MIRGYFVQRNFTDSLLYLETLMTLFRRLSIVLSASALVGCASGHAGMKDYYKDIGYSSHSLLKHIATKGCVLSSRNGFLKILTLQWDTCEGMPPFDPEENDAFAGWLNDLELSDSSFTWPRVTIAGTKPDTVSRTVRAVRQSTELRLRGASSRPFVVSRIEGDPNGRQDALYGIGAGRTDGFDRYFYLVVSNVDLNKPNAEKSRPIADWEVWGTKNGRAVATGRKGTFNYCAVQHPDSIRRAGARFLSCKNLENVAQLITTTNLLAALKGVPLLTSLRAFISAQPQSGLRALSDDTLERWATSIGLDRKDQLTRDRVRQIWDGAFTDPVWIPCGVGCCTSSS